MKKLLFILMFSSLISCGTSIKQLNGDCNVNNEELFKKITSLLLQENFMIKQSDLKLGYLLAEMEYYPNPRSNKNLLRWTFQLNEGKIIAYAKEVNYIQNEYGVINELFEKYYSDETKSSSDWYWNIRNGLEKICNSKIIIIDKQLN